MDVIRHWPCSLGFSNGTRNPRLLRPLAGQFDGHHCISCRYAGRGSHGVFYSRRHQPYCAMDPFDNCRRRGIWHHPDWNRLSSGPFNDDHRRNRQPTGINRRSGCMHILHDTCNPPSNSRALSGDIRAHIIGQIHQKQKREAHWPIKYL